MLRIASPRNRAAFKLGVIILTSGRCPKNVQYPSTISIAINPPAFETDFYGIILGLYDGGPRMPMNDD